MRFYYVYKALAHPEYNDYVTPFSLQERLMHIKEAKRTLGSSIPWLADNMDDELKTALGGVNNCELLIDPAGKVARRRAWSKPEELRKDLEHLVGPVEHVTRVSDLHLKTEPPPKMVARGIVPRVEVTGPMHALRIEANLDDTKQPFYAKLRAEVDDSFLEDGKGTMYIGFHLDPLYHVHWNNLADPLEFDLAVPAGVHLSSSRGKAPRVKEAADADPREFLLDLSASENAEPLHLSVRYFACDDADTFCVPVTQHYRVHLQVDPNAGRVTSRNEGAKKGAVSAQERAARLMRWDTNGDGKIARDEAPERLKKRFDMIDTNGDGQLDADEIKAMAARRRGRRGLSPRPHGR
ncbi:MAG: hypothetical protein ACE5HU_06030 [Acidobacteriota bacterium]